MSGVRIVRVTGLICLMVLVGLTFNSCHLFRKSTAPGKKVSEDENMVRQVLSVQPDWKFMEIRLTGRAEEDDNKVGFMGTVKMEKDRQIFVMIRSTLGFEVARVYANRDSVWMQSKMLNIKESGDWKMAAGKVGYPIDFIAVQGILVQSLFTSSGSQMVNLIEDLVIKNVQDDLRLVTDNGVQVPGREFKYLCDFHIDKQSFFIQAAKIRDIRGQWIADVKYLYSKENVVRKIELKGIDSERNFAVDINVIKREIKDYLEINFDKF